MQTNDLIEALGGTCAVADLVGVQPPSVSGWKQSNSIPDNQLIRLAVIAEERGICTRQTLFPTEWESIWPELAKKRKAPKKAVA